MQISQRYISPTSFELYNIIVTFCVLAVAFLDLGNYAEVASSNLVIPKHVYYLLLGIILPIIAIKHRTFFKFIGSWFGLCMILFVALNCFHLFIYSILGSSIEANITATRINYLVLSIFLVFAAINLRPIYMHNIFVTLVLALVFLQLLDFLIPGVIYPAGTEGAPAGRASSTLINPNKAGESLLLLALLAMPLMSQNRRIWLLSAVLLGVFVTFSRAAILGWIFLVALCVWKRLIDLKKFTIFTFFIIALMLTTTFFVLGYVDYDYQLLEIGLNRIQSSSSFDLAESNTEDRVAVIGYSFQEFCSHPFIGNGTGYTQTWEKFPDVGPHNQNLLLLVEYGILGYCLFALVTVGLIRNGSRSDSKLEASVSIISFIILFYFTMFTHNMFDNLYWLVFIGLISSSQNYCSISFDK